MKILRLGLLCVLVALISVPVVCAAGWVPHCTAEYHEHQASDDHAEPHSSCLDSSQPPVKKLSQIDRVGTAPSPAVPVALPAAGSPSGERHTSPGSAAPLPDRGECPPPLLN